jgi:hypothetical protein
VGFEIYNAGNIVEKDFALFIHLWRNGGPNWIFEEKKYYQEQDSEWKLVSSRRNSHSSTSVFDHLSFSNSKNKNADLRSVQGKRVFDHLVFPITKNGSSLEPNNLANRSYA